MLWFYGGSKSCKILLGLWSILVSTIFSSSSWCLFLPFLFVYVLSYIFYFPRQSALFSFLSKLQLPKTEELHLLNGKKGNSFCLFCCSSFFHEGDLTLLLGSTDCLISLSNPPFCFLEWLLILKAQSNIV